MYVWILYRVFKVWIYECVSAGNHRLYLCVYFYALLYDCTFPLTVRSWTTDEDLVTEKKRKQDEKAQMWTRFVRVRVQCLLSWWSVHKGGWFKKNWVNLFMKTTDKCLDGIFSLLPLFLRACGPLRTRGWFLCNTVSEERSGSSSPSPETLIKADLTAPLSVCFYDQLYPEKFTERFLQQNV